MRNKALPTAGSLFDPRKKEEQFGHPFLREVFFIANIPSGERFLLV
jgi:hypothetical protein